MERGVFIVLIGINSIGKTTQAKMLVDRIAAKGRKVVYQKYAVYNFSPTGPMLNDYLRSGNPYGLSPETFQTLQAMNRLQFESILLENLASGCSVIAEDYIPTSIAWGVAAGVNKKYLVELNSGLRKPNMTVLLDGEQFTAGIEKGHKHESDNALTQRVREIHVELARENGWRIVNANQEKGKVNDGIWFDAGIYKFFV